MSAPEEGGPVQNPIFPSVMVSIARSSGGQTGVVLTFEDRGGDTINIVLGLKQAVNIGKDMMGMALSEMDEDEIEDIDDVSCIKMPEPGSVN